MSENLDFMVQMGFEEPLAKSALSATNGDLEAAVNWAVENKDKPAATSQPALVLGSTTQEPVEGEKNGESENSDLEAKSLKCEDCGKLFKSIEQAEMHSLRTQHENFAESTDEVKPLTAEEKVEQRERLVKLISQRRHARVEEEAEANRQREKERREQGKELVQIKEQMKQLETKKALEDKRREKEEDKLAKQRVLEQIAIDKEERKMRLQREKGLVNEQEAAPVPTAPKAIVKSNAEQARIQVRLPTGGQFQHVFKSAETLAAVRCLLLVKEPDTFPSPEYVSLMCPFQGRKVFQEEDMEKTLAELGLSPSAALMAQKRNIAPPPYQP